MSNLGIVYNPCKNCNDTDKCSMCELTYYRKGQMESTATEVAEVRHGTWLSAYEYAIKSGETDQHWLGITQRDKTWLFCSLCEQQVKSKRNFCPECGAKMDGKEKNNDNSR